MSCNVPYGANDTLAFPSIRTPRCVHLLWKQLRINVQGKLTITNGKVEWLHMFDGRRQEFDQPCCPLIELGSWDCVHVYTKKVIRNENCCLA